MVYFKDTFQQKKQINYYAKDFFRKKSLSALKKRCFCVQEHYAHAIQMPPYLLDVLSTREIQF
jgi:hypothetical protein